MKSTKNIERAIERAAVCHHGHFRKAGEELPYITHPFIVALYVAQFTDDENTIIAALMHDTVEDTPYTLEDLSKEFGEDVCDIVAGVSEDNVHPDGSKKPWQHRKDDYLEKIANAPLGSVFVSLADKIHNMRSIIFQCTTEEGPSVWEAHSAGNEKQVWFHEEVLRVGKERLGAEHPLIAEYEDVLARAKKTVGVV